MPFHVWPDRGRTTRREFLAGLALGGAALGIVRASSRADEPDRWLALVSDTHIPADPGQKSLGQVPFDNLRTVVADILAQTTRPEGVLINGDLALKEGLASDYATFLAALEPLRKAAIPLHLALGNHDDRVKFREAARGVADGSAIEEKQVGAFDAVGYRFVVLDSLDKVNGTPGRLGEAQLTWLGRELDAHKGRPTLVSVHHNPRSPNGQGLLDDDALFAVLKPRPWVEGLIFGHTHRWNHAREGDLHLVNIPAVAYVFQPEQPLGYCRLVPTADGCRIELRDLVRKRAEGAEAHIPLSRRV
jgi:3',5'-cyclic AMP phosphodiesterase CpdA